MYTELNSGYLQYRRKKEHTLHFLLSCCLQIASKRHSDKPCVGIFSLDKHILLIPDVDLVKNILVKIFQYFIDRVICLDENATPYSAGFSLRSRVKIGVIGEQN